MTRSANPKLIAYVVIGAGLLGAGAVLGRPELAVLAAPFLVAVIVGVGWARSLSMQVNVHAGPTRLVEGDVTTVQVTLAMDVRRAAGARMVELLVSVPDGLECSSPNPAATTFTTHEPTSVSFALVTRRWGAYQLGRAHFRVRDPLGLFVFDGEVDTSTPVRVFPSPQHLAEIVTPFETQPQIGSHAARAVGSGIEFAGIRALGPGEPVRGLNWRATLRRGAPHVTERHAEQAGEVVLFLDTFSPIGLDRVVRAAAALATEYLRERDRVGVVGFGGTVRWLRGGMGLAQQYRIAETLIDTRVFVSYAWKDATQIPRPVIPPRALVVAFSPLTDERARTALAGLRLRECDVVLVTPTIEDVVAPRRDDIGRLAHRLWRLDLIRARDQFRAMGISVVEWTPSKSAAEVVHEARLLRSRARRRPGA